MKLISERSAEPGKALSMKIPAFLPVPGLQKAVVHKKSVAFTARNVKEVLLLVLRSQNYQ